MGFGDIKHSVANYPSSGEKLTGYLQRTSQNISQIEAWSVGHLAWYTHTRMGSCWICDSIKMSRIMCDVITDILEQLPKHKFVCHLDKNSGSWTFEVSKRA